MPGDVLVSMDDLPLSALDTLCLGSTLALSSLFYYLYWRQRAAVRRIQNSEKLQLDGDLRRLLESSGSRELRYVALEGTVGAVSASLRSQNQPHLHVVIQRHVVTEHRLLWNSLTRNWSESERVLHESVNSVPFQLCPLGGAGDPVIVCDPLKASGLALETIHERFYAPSPGFGELLGHYLSGQKPKGLLETEEILPVGATLTGLGQLVLDTQGGAHTAAPTGRV
ncbi:mitochondrial ubiquitin ligase activator of nfkb 1-A-like [Ascaphus truei]|uniref:mitochondrial ubiquitin ligase activator of nfkb 1-A-like n=1 Tax=Ascaphus truei TaxID=8439 RepID=UPI003F5AC97B